MLGEDEGENVKTEFFSARCRGCLSTGRRLSPLIDYKLYFSLLSEKQKLEVMMESEILMCWECNALMRKVIAFQIQAREAHTVLENCNENATTKKTSLSQLTICKKQDYDVIIEDSTDGLTNELSDCHFLDTTDFKDEIIDDTIEHKTDEENVIDMDIIGEHFDANGDESCMEEFDNLSLGQDSAANCVINTKIKAKQLILPVRDRLQRAVKTTVQKRPITCLKKQKLKTKKNKASKTTKEVVRIAIEIAQNPVKIEVEEVSEVESDEANQNSDPDFEKESQVSNKSEPTVVKRKHKYKLCYKKKEDFERVMCRTEKFKYSFRDLDTLFTELKLSEKEVARALEKQPSYKTEEYKYECYYCGLCFTFNHTLEKHRRMCHKQLIKSLRCKDPMSPLFYRYRMYRCGACFAVLREEHRAAHMKYSHVWRFFCSQCKEVFWDKDLMRAHWRSTHWPYSCDNCDATLTSKWLLVKHMWQHHRASKPYRCEDCGARTVSQYNLQVHRARMHSREDSAPEQRYCVTCDKLFATTQLYQDHSQRTTAHNVKKTWVNPALFNSGRYLLYLYLTK